jgi:endogenous inhibitor of DNA gyrase (YacG/DUF329 family)
LTACIDFAGRLPDDISGLESTEDGFTASVSMPLDENGFFGRQCPSCERFFKMNHEEYKGLPDELQLTCPYCGHETEHSDFMSPDQRQRALAATTAIGMQFVHQMVNESFSSAVAGSRSITYTPGSPPPVSELPTYVEEAVERVVACPVCGLHAAVYGASTYCPACAARPSLDGIRSAIEHARTSLRLPEMVSEEHRQELESQGVFESISRESVKQVVTLFEVFGQEQFEARVDNSEEVLRGKGKVFQRLADADSLFEDHAGFSLHALVSAEAWRRLLRTFARRHVLVHRNGQADEPYLTRYPTEGLLVGQRLVVDEAEATLALADLEALVDGLAAR